MEIQVEALGAFDGAAAVGDYAVAVAGNVNAGAEGIVACVGGDGAVAREP